MEQHREYRVTINIRRKGEGYMEGLELKTEHFNSLDELLEKSYSFISQSIEEASEGSND